jgi:hypothetical protein
MTKRRSSFGEDGSYWLRGYKGKAAATKLIKPDAPQLSSTAEVREPYGSGFWFTTSIVGQGWVWVRDVLRLWPKQDIIGEG